MTGSPRWSRATALLVLIALIALIALPPLASAQAPGTVVLALRVNAGPVELKPGPLVVPDPWVPNPTHAATLVADGTPADAAPVRIVDAPEGVYVDTPAGPITVLGYTSGFEQKHIAPVEWAGHVFDANTQGLPIGIDGCACPARAPTVAGTYKDIELPLGRPPSSPPAVPGQAAPPRNEPAALGLSSAAPLADVTDYHLPLVPAADASGVPAMEQAAAVDPSPAAPLVYVLAGAAASLVLVKLLLPLYHRFKAKTALDNGTRKQIYELLRAAPGASAAELGAQSGLHVTTVKYHLDVLRKVGMVGEQVVDGCRRFYSYENGDRMEFLTRALLDEPAARAIYRQIEQHPGLPFIEVARALGMRKEHVHYHVKKLTKHGLVTDRWEAGRRLLFVGAQQHGPPGPPPQLPSASAAPPVLVLAGPPPEVKG